MFLAFDYPVPFSTMGRRSVSNVPAQALTLLNNPFVIDQATRFAARVAQQASDPAAQVDRAMRIALARPATDQEIAIGADLIRKQSLDAFAHVVLNLDEFMYMR